MHPGTAIILPGGKKTFLLLMDLTYLVDLLFLVINMVYILIMIELFETGHRGQNFSKKELITSIDKVILRA